MAVSREEELQHLLRRAGFGASEAEVTQYARRGLLAFGSAVGHLLAYQEQPDDVDAAIQTIGHVNVTPSIPGQFLPASNINDARQRWLFRMVHTKRPLQEKMTLFWHNHFATAYTKIAGEAGATEAARMMAAKPAEDPGAAKGHLEVLREHALGNFRDLLVAMAQDPAMLYWLDGRTNVRARPQENFARELMELFTMGVDTFTENDVYAGARVFTGWNLARTAGTGAHFVFNYNAAQHETTAKEFSFPIYANGGRVIPARSAAAGMQDGLDLIDAVARHPATGPRLARKLYNFFVNEVDSPDTGLIDEVAGIYYARNFEIEPMVRRLLLSSQFRDPANYFRRYSWPAEFVVRAVKEVGWVGFSVGDALTPMVNMGQQLLEPPDVNGWELGRGWFTTGAMLARMNFASSLAGNQKATALLDAFRGHAATPDDLVDAALDRLSPAPYSASARQALLDYVNAGGTWSASTTQIANKGAGIVHLIVGSGEYQLY